MNVKKFAAIDRGKMRLPRWSARVSNLFPALFLLTACLTGLAGPRVALAAGTCTSIPPIDPTKGFVANFNNPCYALPLAVGNSVQQSGDLNAVNDEVYYQIAPGYELVLLGTFPNARFLLASAYDDHLLPVANLVDSAIVPLSSTMTNPFLTGATYKPNQIYGLTITFGGGQPVNVSPGCSTSATNIDKNVLNASQIHQGVTWTGYPSLPPGFPAHETGANASGIIMIRKYADIDSPPINEEVIVRSLANGCAIPLQQALKSNLISLPTAASAAWLHMTQINAHTEFVTSIEPWYCFPPDPQNKAVWSRNAEYIPVLDTYDPFLKASLSPRVVQSLLAGQSYMRVQFQLPTTPNIPCTNGSCSLTGNEQTRYVSLSIQAPAQTMAGPATLFSIDDRSFVKDPNGNVTLVIGFGAPQPATVTAANYYTWVDASATANISTMNLLRFRHVYASASFACSAGNVPFRTTEYNPVGGYMGNYVPTVDYPTAAQIPPLPSPPSRPNSCYLVPPQPSVCGSSSSKVDQ